MADELQTARLQSIDGSHDTIARLASQRTKFRGAVKALTTERDAAKAEIVALKQQVIDAAKTGGAEEIAALKATIRDNAHRGKFDELAKAAGVKPKALQDLWERSGYKAEGDVPDEAKIKVAIETQRTDRDYLFEPAAAQGEGADEGNPDTPPEPKPGPGRGQGGTQRSTGTQFQATDAQLRDPAWCFANADKLAAMSKDVSGLAVNQVASKFAIV